MLSKKYFKTKDEVEVTFEIEAPDVDKVHLVCEGLGWDPVEMKRADRGKGPFRTRIRLPKDRQIQFRYLFDDHQWENDDAADGYWPNEHGTDNSVVDTAA